MYKHIGSLLDSSNFLGVVYSGKKWSWIVYVSWCFPSVIVGFIYHLGLCSNLLQLIAKGTIWWQFWRIIVLFLLVVEWFKVPWGGEGEGGKSVTDLKKKERGLKKVLLLNEHLSTYALLGLFYELESIPSNFDHWKCLFSFLVFLRPQNNHSCCAKLCFKRILHIPTIYFKIVEQVFWGFSLLFSCSSRSYISCRSVFSGRCNCCDEVRKILMKVWWKPLKRVIIWPQCASILTDVFIFLLIFLLEHFVFPFQQVLLFAVHRQYCILSILTGTLM